MTKRASTVELMRGRAEVGLSVMAGEGGAVIDLVGIEEMAVEGASLRFFDGTLLGPEEGENVLVGIELGAAVLAVGTALEFTLGVTEEK